MTTNDDKSRLISELESSTDSIASMSAVLTKYRMEVDRLSAIVGRMVDEEERGVKEYLDLRDVADRAISDREKARDACHAAWHDLGLIGSLCKMAGDESPRSAVCRVIEERDLAKSFYDKVVRERDTRDRLLREAERERDDALSRVKALEEDADSLRSEGWFKFRGGYIEDASGGKWWSAAHLARTEAERDEARAEVAKLGINGMEHIAQRDAMRRERDEARETTRIVMEVGRRAQDERDAARASLSARWSLMRELEEALGIPSGPASDEQLLLGVQAIRSLVAERDEARAESERLRHERRQLRARLVECLPWLGVCPTVPSLIGDLCSVKCLVDDTLAEVKE